MVMAGLVFALIVMSVTALYFYLKGDQKDRDISRLEARVAFLDDAWKTSRDLNTKQLTDYDTSLREKEENLRVKEEDIVSLISKLDQKDQVITEMAHEINRLSTPTPPKEETKKKPSPGKKPVKPRAKKPKK